MKVELPELKRCCFCIPLRYGLLTMAYMKLILMLLVCLFLISELHYFVVYVLSFRGAAVTQLIIGIIMLLLTLLDISFTIVFLVGGHQKNMKLLRVYSIYCIVCLGVFSLFILVQMILEIYVHESAGRSNEGVHEKIASYVVFLRFQYLVVLAIIGSHAYFFLLIRSEMNKLESNCNFRFVNTGNEAEILYTLENGIIANELGSTTNKSASGVDENGTRVHTNGVNVHDNETNGQDYN